MKTAVTAGMYPAGALWGFRDADELRASGAKVLLKRPEDLMEIIFLKN
jgi:phosphoglycolate phosphatase